METLRPVSSSKGDAGPGDLEVSESIANDLRDTLENIFWKDCITVPYRFLFCFHCLWLYCQLTEVVYSSKAHHPDL